MKKRSICNCFNGFLIFVLFFNFLFFSMEDVFAISQKTEIGPRDRIRKFEELDFKYIPLSENGKVIDGVGFSCKPQGIKTFNLSFTLSDIKDSAKSLYEVAVNIFLFPVLCIGILKAFGQFSSGDNSLLSGLLVIITILGLHGLEYVESLIFDVDDYNLDPNNPYCFGVAVSMMVWCLVMSVIFKLPIKTWIKLSIIVSINASIYTAKEIESSKQYEKAKSVFNDLSLCGDNWLTYGSEELEELASGRVIRNKSQKDNKDLEKSQKDNKDLEKSQKDNKDLKESQENNEDWKNYIRTSFPVKGAFLGSYKHKLNKCFREKNAEFCRNLFLNNSMTDKDIDSKTTHIYKQYREFLYGGIEYSYNDCTDPRQERRSYLSTPNSKSQLYYFRGNEAANFACERFLINNTQEFREAYDCCLEASQKLICIADNRQKIHVMCEKDSVDGKCGISGNYNIEENPDLEDSNYCSDLKNILNENRSEICNKTEPEEDCAEVLNIYNEVCDKNGNINNKPNLAEASKSTKSNDIKFKIVKSSNVSTGTKYCVETFNLCPYNFRLLGGTEKYGMEFSPSYKSGFKVKEVNKDKEGNSIYTDAKENESDAEYNKKNNCTFDENGNRHCMGPCYEEGETGACFSKPSNFCQIDRHCVTIPTIDEQEVYYTSPYIDDACINNIGSSHNLENYTPVFGIPSKSTRLLTAPLVECTVETFKNILLNRAGHTRCTNLKETPVNNSCLSGEIEYKKGQDLTEAHYNSPFKKIKDYFINIVKAIMALAVLLYGYNIIIMHKGATTEEFIKFILTLSFVGYFSVSNNWIPYIFNSVYSVYNRVAEFAVEILAEDKEYYNYNNEKYGGCFFLNGEYINNNYDLYGDRKYLAIFDTFDCSFARYIGYSGKNANIPAIIMIFVVGFLTFGLNILMMLPFILLFFSLLFFIIRIAYIFIVNSLTITILLFMTPVFVPMILFERTKGMFKSWLTKILQSAISPLFIFMSLSMFFVIFDKYYFADAKFFGKNEPYRDMYCGSICKIDSNEFFYISNNSSDYKEECSKAGGKVISLTLTAPICFVSQVINKQSDGGTGIFSFFISGFSGTVSNITTFFNENILNNVSELISMFFSVMFLIVIIFLFEQMIGYVNAMTGAIFGSEGGGYSGVDDSAQGLPTLQTVLNVVASAGAKLANATKNNPKAVVNNIINHFDRKKEDEAIRDGGQTESEDKSKETDADEAKS